MNTIIEKITILPGINKRGIKETFSKIDIEKGDIIAIVGSTGAGKSQLLYDIEKIAQGDTKSKRKILVDDQLPKKEFRFDPRKKLIASLSQSMNFFTDLTVREFLELHIQARGQGHREGLVEQVIAQANEITGEPICDSMNILNLSGGQTRALMVSDIANISTSPIILVDEIENAGIRKNVAIKTLVKEGKIVLIVTHDPVITLNADKRLIIKEGGIVSVLKTSPREKEIASYLNCIDERNMDVRDKIRNGEFIDNIENLCEELKFKG